MGNRFINVVTIFNATYIFVCALLNRTGAILTQPLSIKVLMVVSSTTGALILITYFIKQKNSITRSVKSVIFMDVILPVLWNVIAIVKWVLH